MWCIATFSELKARLADSKDTAWKKLAVDGVMDCLAVRNNGFGVW